jgi:hypothetical protein
MNLTRGCSYKYYGSRSEILTVVYLRSFKNAWSGRMYYEFGTWSDGCEKFCGRVILTQTQVTNYIMLSKTSDARVAAKAKALADRERDLLAAAERRVADAAHNVDGAAVEPPLAEEDGAEAEPSLAEKE